MTSLHSFKDNKSGCFANIRMDNHDPCYIGVAQTGVIVKKSRIGLLGAMLYKERNLRKVVNSTKALNFLYPENLTPTRMTTPALKAFTNAILHCATVAEVAQILNSAVSEAERQSGKPIEEFEIAPKRQA